jgi:hypothetical protein
MDLRCKFNFKRIVAPIVAALFVIQGIIIAPPGGVTAAEAASVTGLELSAPRKTDFGLDNAETADGKKRKPNVLFMIDMTTPMTFPPKSVFPTVTIKPRINDTSSGTQYYKADTADWDKTKGNFNFHNFDDISRAMKMATFGAGTLPTTSSRKAGGINKQRGTALEYDAAGVYKFLNNLYGRDVDSGNNYKESKSDLARDMEKYRYKYLFPFAEDGSPIRDAFKTQDTMPGWSAFPKSGSDKYPYALVFKDPKHWNGWTGSGAPKPDDLVPNDSRIYQLKIALWHMLTGNYLNGDIRFGLATTFASPRDVNNPLRQAHFKTAPFGNGVVSTNFYNKKHVNGTMWIRNTGQGTREEHIDSAHFSGWGTSGTENQVLLDLSSKNHNIAYLRLPIAEYGQKWTAGGKTINHAQKFKLWLDGVNDINDAGGSFYYHRNPELIPTGAPELLARSIYPEQSGYGLMARQDAAKIERIIYSEKDTDVQSGDLGGIGTIRFMAGSGEASGTVFDFFSPPVINTPEFKHGENKALIRKSSNFHDLSFPIRDVCEDNWVILITSGVDRNAIDAINYHTMHAIQQLYYYTSDDSSISGNLTRKVTMAKFDQNGKRTLVEAKLKKPIRTLVIGLVPSKADMFTVATDRTIMNGMLEDLTMMARVGQGYASDDVKSKAKPFLADDAESMLTALQDAVAYILNEQEQFDKGTDVSAPGFNESKNDDSLNLFSATYRHTNDDQWAGKLARFKAKTEKDGKTTITREWELGEKLAANRGRRNLVFWSGGSMRPVASNMDAFRDLTGMTQNRMDAGNLPYGFGSMEPHRALNRWFQGYEYSYAKSGQEFPRANMLSDFGQSGTVIVKDPNPANSLPGYWQWASDIEANSTGQAPMLYTQTNDGVLHVVDPADGSEKIAVLPPSSLLPGRLATLKTSPIVNNKLQWIDVSSQRSTGHPRSNAVYLLDGPLQRNYINLSGSGKPEDWGVYLTGTLGRGGNGIFMYDVSNHASPKLMWYKEQLPQGLVSMSARDGEPRVDANAYLNIGLNSPKPAIGVVKPPATSTAQMTPFIALPGGVQSNGFDPKQNGGEGASLLFLNPEDGSVIRSLDGKSVKPLSRVGGGVTGRAPYMGMMTTPPALVSSMADRYYTGQMFTADNRGNIFRVAFEEETSDDVKPIAPHFWEAETVATLQSAASASTSDDSYAIPRGLGLGYYGDELWLAGGTSDVPLRQTGGAGESFLKNASQLIFAFRAPQPGASPLYRDIHWKKLVAQSSTLGDENLALAPGDKKEGWYIQLQQNASGRESMVSNPIVVNNVLYAATFVQQDVDVTNPDMCIWSSRVEGASRIYALDLTTGAAAAWSGGKKYIEIKGIKITGINQTKRGNYTELLVSYDILNGKNGLASVGENKIARLTAENLDILKINAGRNGGGSGGGKINIDGGDGMVLYWRMYEGN